MAVEFTYELINNGKEYRITRSSGSGDENNIISIPNEYNGKPVTSIKRLYSSTSVVVFNDQNVIEIIIPDSIKEVGQNAIQCKNLQKLHIGKNVESVLNICPSGPNRNLKEITVSDGNKNSFSEDGVLFYKSGSHWTLQYPAARDGEEYIIPNTVTSLHTNAFVQTTNLKTLYIPSSVSSMVYGAFAQGKNNSIEEIYCQITPSMFSILVNELSKSSNFKTGHNSPGDHDFTGFTFNGKHSLLDLNIIRVSDGQEYNTQLSPQARDKTAEVPYSDGQYFFGTNHSTRTFDIKIAFDSLTEKELRGLRQFASQKELGDLIFDEEPYKVYTAKINGVPTLNYIPFEQDGQRVYKGKGTIQFICFYPYAHTPDQDTKISMRVRTDGVFGSDGKLLTNYNEWIYTTKSQWKNASGLVTSGSVNRGENYGDLPTHFTLSASLSGKKKVIVGDYYIELALGNETTIIWNSQTGIVSTVTDAGKKIIPYLGMGCGVIPIEGISSDQIKIQDWNEEEESWKDQTSNQDTFTLKYHYWYY